MSGTIAGAPSVEQGETSYTVTATNRAGVTQVTLLLEVLPEPPALIFNVAGYRLVKGRSGNIVPVNVGGAVTACTDRDASISALGLAIDQGSCAISGAPISAAP